MWASNGSRAQPSKCDRSSGGGQPQREVLAGGDDLTGRRVLGPAHARRRQGELVEEVRVEQRAVQGGAGDEGQDHPALGREGADLVQRGQPDAVDALHLRHVELEDGDAGVDVRGHRPAQRGGDLGGEASAEPYLGVRSPVQGMGRGRRHDAYLADIQHAPVDPQEYRPTALCSAQRSATSITSTFISCS